MVLFPLSMLRVQGQNWAGVWINLDTAVDSANGEVMTADVYSTEARDITLKFDAANVERVASHTGSGWEALSYDFTGAVPADQTKIAFFNDLSQQGDGTDAWTIYIDNLAQASGGDTGGGDTGGGDTGATIALPVGFEEAAADYEIAGFDGGVASVEAGPDGAVSLKYVKGAGQNWAGVWINLDTAVDSANGEVMTADVYSTEARDITLKFDAANVERVASHTGSGWEALSYDFTGAVPADQTKIAFFNDLSQQGDGTDAWTIYIDNLAQASGGDTGGGDTGGTDTGPKDVTFSVDMTGVDLTDGNPTLQSTFNNWCGGCNPMSDDDGDNIWTVTVNIPQGDHEYKYALGVWVSQESVPADCDNTIGANRAVTVTGDVTLATDVYNGCPGDDTSVGYTPADGFVIAEAFGDTVIDGSVFTYPAGAQSWGGFANMNTSLYPITVSEDSVITFTGSVPAGGDADVRFRFEFNPHPDVDPSFNTEAVTVTGADAATYSVCVPAQGDKTFSSFLMYLDTRDVGVSVTDIAISADATCGDTGGGDTGGGDTGGSTGSMEPVFDQPFDGTTLENGVYNFPASANAWAGFINSNTAIYPIVSDTFKCVDFQARVPSGNGEPRVYFKLESNPWPNNTESSTTPFIRISGSNWTNYSTCMTSTGDQQWNQLVFYISEFDRDEPLEMRNIELNWQLAVGSGNTGGDTGATIALPVDFEEAAADYEIAGFDGGVASVEAGPDGANSLKYVKGAGQNWAGVWINLDTAVDSANGEVMTADVYSTEARDITLKFDAANVERVASHTGSGWEALSYDFTGAVPADQTKIAFFNDLSQQGDGTDAWTIYIDNLAQASGGDTGGGDTGGGDTAATIALPVDFEEAAC
jgi:hypothetical protein